MVTVMVVTVVIVVVGIVVVVVVVDERTVDVSHAFQMISAIF